jgi:hypothetical protein
MVTFTKNLKSSSLHQPSLWSPTSSETGFGYCCTPKTLPGRAHETIERKGGRTFPIRRIRVFASSSSSSSSCCRSSSSSSARPPCSLLPSPSALPPSTSPQLLPHRRVAASPICMPWPVRAFPTAFSAAADTVISVRPVAACHEHTTFFSELLAPSLFVLARFLLLRAVQLPPCTSLQRRLFRVGGGNVCLLFIQKRRRLRRCAPFLYEPLLSVCYALPLPNQTKLSSTALAVAAKHALRFLTFRGVSDALFGLYMLYWFRCFERMMGPRKCEQPRFLQTKPIHHFMQETSWPSRRSQPARTAGTFPWPQRQRSCPQVCRPRRRRVSTSSDSPPPSIHPSTPLCCDSGLQASVRALLATVFRSRPVLPVCRRSNPSPLRAI